MRIAGGEVFDGERFIAADVVIHDDRIVQIEETSITETPSHEEVLDAHDCYVVPGFIDIHFHGCCGADLCDGSDDALSVIGRYEAKRGVTAICPATMTYPEDVLSNIVGTAAAHVAANNEAAFVGINMEGPFISRNNIGAQNPAYVQVPDKDMLRRLQEASGGLIKLVDIAPEAEGALEFIDAVKDEMCVSLAHTTADYTCAKAAFERGARQLTHLYNAMPGLHHREPGPIGAAFENPHAMVEVIADGIHIHPVMVQVAFTLFGDDRVILVSDSMRAAGLDDGEYDLGGQSVTVRGNKATLASGTIAGSVTDLAECVRIAVKDMGIPLESALKAATINPARSIGLEAHYGHLTPGAFANAVILNKDLTINQVILRGTPL